MFRRLHVSSAFEGTGIGLALCKKIVEKHHGFITANSKADEGTTFIVSLPVYQPVKVGV
jgi:signal transduction histidine kinase